MPLLKNYCEVRLDANLDELRRKKEIESLRPHIAHAACFHPTKDPATAAITIDDLKRMARAWKLHEKTRNFWKTHVTKESLTDALLQYIRDTGKVPPMSKAEEAAAASPPRPLFGPLPPKHDDPRKSISSYRTGKNAAVNRRLSSMSSPLAQTSKEPRFNHFKTKIFGREREFVNTTTESMLVHTRFFPGAAENDDSNVKKIVEKWRVNNFMSDGDGNTAAKAARMTASEAEQEHTREIMEARVLKQRNIATHLHNLSADPDLKLDQLQRKALEAFLVAGESDDLPTVEKIMQAYANITVSPRVRGMLLEMSVLHRAQTLFPMLQSPESLSASIAFIHQMSQDAMTEDKVYNSCFATMQNHCMLPDPQQQLTSVYSLNNLLPCSEPHRVGELIIATISSLQTKNQQELHRIFEIVFNMSTFSALHDTLVECEVVQMISQAAASAGAVGDVRAARLFALFLHNVSVSAESMAPQLLAIDYVATFLDLDKVKDPIVVKHAVHTLAMLSCSTTTPLCAAAADPEVVSVVLRHIENGIKGHDTVPDDVFSDAVTYLHNVMCNTSCSRVVKFEVLDNVGCIKLLLKLCTHENATVRARSATALRSAFTNEALCVKYASAATAPLLQTMERDNDVDAVLALCNLACFKKSEISMVQDGTHIKLLEWMAKTSEPHVKSACLRVLVQLTGNEACVLALLGSGLMPKLLEELKNFEPEEDPKKKKNIYYEEEEVPPAEDELVMWLAVSRVCVAVSARKLDMSMNDRRCLELILNKVCMPLASLDVLVQCSWCMAFLSLSPVSFLPIEAQLKVLLEKSLHETEFLLETCSTLMYNLTCQSSNTEMMLRSEYYLNIMIHMMRGGKEVVQSNVVEAMRNMCCHASAAKWLLQKDILPDFVVIALLRTNSETIKSTCCDAFYNLLCHEEPRTTFIGGDLWWGTMKVARSEVERIRVVSAKALFNLSCRPEYAIPLRKQTLLSFAKDFVHFAAGSENFLKSVLLSVHNAVRRFPTPLDANERLCVTEMAMKSLDVCREPEQVSLALKMLLKAAHDSTAADKNFVELDVMGCLERNRSAWLGKSMTTVLVSHILLQMCAQPSFTKAVPFQEMQSTLVLVHSNLYQLVNAAGSNSMDVNISTFVRENSAGILATYASRREMTRETLLRCPLWSEVVALPLAARDRSPDSKVTSSPLRHLALEMTSFCSDAIALGRPNSARPPTAPVPGSMSPGSVGGGGMSPLFSRKTSEMKSDSPLAEAMASDRPLSTEGVDAAAVALAGEFEEHLNVEIAKGLLGVDLLFQHTKNTEPQYDPMTGTFKSPDASAIEQGAISTLNMMHLIFALSQTPRTAQILVSADVSASLLGLLKIDRSGLPESVQLALAAGVGGLERFITSILLTLSAEPDLQAGLLASQSLAVCLTRMLDTTQPAAGASAQKANTYAGEIFRDMATLLYRFAHCELTDDHPINSQLIINVCETMLSRSQLAGDEECVRICRHVIGFTMDTFRLDQTCSMDNVQAMLVELRDEESNELPTIIKGRTTAVPEIALQQPAARILERGDGFAHCELVETAEPSGCWKLISVTKLKPMTSLLSKMDAAQPFCDFSAKKVDPYPLIGYHKMIRETQVFPSSPSFKKGKGPGVNTGGLVLSPGGTNIQGINMDYDDDDFEEDDEGNGGTEVRLPQST